MCAGRTGVGADSRARGRGLSWPVADAEELGAELAAVAEFALGRPYPNPARAGATVRFTLPRAMHVRLVAYDVLGRAVATVTEGDMDAGAHTATLGVELASGTYVLRLEGRGLARTQPLTVLR